MPKQSTTEEVTHEGLSTTLKNRTAAFARSLPTMIRQRCATFWRDVVVPQNAQDAILKIAVVVLSLLLVNIALGWMLSFYYHHSVIGDLSFIGHDPVVLPPGVLLHSALGNHYFGDFEQYVGYAKSPISPYSTQIGTPAYGPLSIVIVKVLNGIVGWPASVFVFLLGSVALLFVGLYRLLGRSTSALILSMLLLTSGPVVSAIDRGNIQIFLGALLVWFCIGVLENRRLCTIVVTVIAIALKGYEILLILFFVKQKRWRDLVLTLAWSAVIYVVSFLIVGGNLFTDIRNLLHTDFGFSKGLGTGFMLGSVSALSAIYKGLFLLWGIQHFLHFVQHNPGWTLQIPGGIILLLSLFIAWSMRLHDRRYRVEISMVVLFAVLQLVPDATAPYVQFSLVIEMVLLARLLFLSPAHDIPPPLGHTTIVPRPVLMLCLTFAIIGASPWVGFFYGLKKSSTPVFAFVGPWMNVFIVLALFVGAAFDFFRHRRLEPGTSISSPSCQPQREVALRTNE